MDYKPKRIPISVKRKCLEMKTSGATHKQIYEEYYKLQVENPQCYEAFRRAMNKWKKYVSLTDETLENGTYEGFVAHDATVQVSRNGEIVQAWIKQKAGDLDLEAFLNAIKENIEPYDYTHISKKLKDPFNMLEIPLFDMHWGIAFMDYYEVVLKEILGIIHSHSWNKIVIPFGQDFFHNDSIVKGITTKGTVIEKVNMTKAVKDGRKFICTIIDAAISQSKEVKVIYTAGNHDRSISWMFVQVLLERYGPLVVDDSFDYRKVVTYGKNSIMITHGDSKQATARNLANIFPISFAEEFANANVREVHAGHLHHESEADIYGVMVRRLSSGAKLDDWSNKEDYVGFHKRFMLFDWGADKLDSIHYI